MNDEGVQILQQHDTYEPQIVTYNMVGGNLDRHTINTILTSISSLHGVPKTEGSLILSQLESSKNPFKHDTRTGHLKDSKILQYLSHDGRLHAFHVNQ